MYKDCRNFIIWKLNGIFGDSWKFGGTLWNSGQCEWMIQAYENSTFDHFNGTLSTLTLANLKGLSGAHDNFMRLIWTLANFNVLFGTLSEFEGTFGLLTFLCNSGTPAVFALSTGPPARDWYLLWWSYNFWAIYNMNRRDLGQIRASVWYVLKP